MLLFEITGEKFLFVKRKTIVLIKNVSRAPQRYSASSGDSDKTGILSPFQ